MIAGAAVLFAVAPYTAPLDFKLAMMGASLTIGGIADELRGGPGNAFSTKQPAASRQIVYGQMRVSGTIVFESTTGHQLNQVIVWAAHQCQSIDKVYIDGKQVHFAGGASSGNADGATYFDDAGNRYSFPDGGRLYVEHALGTTAGHWFASLSGNDPKWTSVNTLNGLTASYVKTTADTNVYAGPPGVKVALHGKSDIYDPRDGTHKWTDNAALIIADFLTNTEFGVGCTWDEVDTTQLIAAANICDEQVLLANGQYESRYTINGFFQTSTTPGDILDSMLMSCEGRISYSGGQWKIYPAAWYGTSIAFTQDDFAGPVKWVAKRKFRELCNAVRATYISPTLPYSIINSDRNFHESGIFDGQWQPADAPEYAQDPAHGYASGDANLTQDGGKLYFDRRYQFVTSVATVQRLMKIFLMRNRQQGSGMLQMQLAAWQTQAQDVITVDFPTLGWSGKNLEVQQFHFVPKFNNSGEAPSLMCELDVVETDPSVYTWSTSEERGIEDTNSPTLFNNFQVGAPTNLVLESGLDSALVATDGVVTPRIHATWTEPDDPFVTTGGHIVIQMQLVGATGWRTVAMVDGTVTEHFIDNVVCGQQYNVEVYAIRATGAASAALAVGPHTVSQTTSSFTSTTLNGGSIAPGQLAILNWTSTSSSVNFTWAAQNLLRGDNTYLNVQAGSQSFTGLVASTTYYTYWYVVTTNGAMGFTNPVPPSSTPSSLLLAQCFLDGRYGIGTIPVTTSAVSGGGGSGTGGGGDKCPEAAELVEVKDKGRIPAGQVQVGDLIKGKCFERGEDVYRKVTNVITVSSMAWRMIDGHRVSPCEAVYWNDQWMPAYKVPTATFDAMKGVKVKISVESDEYNEQNYYLVAGKTLLIHNFGTPVLPC